MNNHGSFPFKDKQVRTIMDAQGNVERVCLVDICTILNREEMIRGGQAVRLCPSSIQQMYQGRAKPLWFVIPLDVYKLTRQIRTESKRIAALCDEVDSWIGELPVSMAAPPVILPEVPGKEEPVVFTYNDNPISFKAENGKTFINATQMARSFGKLPDEWLRLADTMRFRDSLVQSGKFPDTDSQVIRVRGRNGATWIEESLAMEFSRWLSPEFSKWCNDCVEKLVKQGYVDLKEESSGPFDKTNGEYPVPKTFSEALLLAAKQQEEIQRNKHKVEFYDNFIENRDWYKTSTVADELDITTRRLNQFLAENGITRYEKKQWVVRTQYQALQTEIKYYWTNSQGKTYAFGAIRRWTKAGREYILELWKQQNPDT